MEESRFSFKIISRLNIRCDRVNAPKGSSFIKSPYWLRFKNVTLNSKNVVDKCFRYAFALT